MSKDTEWEFVEETDNMPKKFGTVKKGSDIEVVEEQYPRMDDYTVYKAVCPGDECDHVTVGSLNRTGAITTVKHHIKNTHRIR